MTEIWELYLLFAGDACFPQPPIPPTDWGERADAGDQGSSPIYASTWASSSPSGGQGALSPPWPRSGEVTHSEPRSHDLCGFLDPLGFPTDSMDCMSVAFCCIPHGIPFPRCSPTLEGCYGKKAQTQAVYRIPMRTKSPYSQIPQSPVTLMETHRSKEHASQEGREAFWPRSVPSPL